MMKWQIPAVVAALTLSAAMTHAAPLSERAVKAHDPNAPVYIVTAAKTYASEVGAAAKKLRTTRDAMGTELVLARMEGYNIPELVHYIHGKEHRCGGFFAFETQAEAERFLREDKTAEAMRRNFATYTIDNQATVTPWIPQVSEPNIRATITHLSTAYPNRYYASSHGRNSALWIRDTWLALANGRSDVSAELFTNCSNCSTQPSVILTIQGSTLPDEIVVLGGHLDSISNSGSGETMRAPGADDDASGIATLTEVLRIALANGWKPKRTVKFMGYAAEEVGLRGSYAIARQFKSEGRNVVGVLQLDMTNYKGSSSFDVRVMTDYTNAALTQFLKDLFTEYLGSSGLKLSTTACGYACSDHASWTGQGFPAAMYDEASKFPYLHTTSDTLASLGNSAASSANIAKLGLAFVGELAKTAGGGGGNAPPVAAFNHRATALAVSFTNTSTDSDGTLAGSVWEFGDGTSSTDSNPLKTYAASGNYNVKLTVTDDKGASASISKFVSVTDGSSACGGTPYSGSFSGANGQSQIQPNGTWYQSTSAGSHKGCLRGPEGTDFDLYLDKWNGSSWTRVASSTSSGPSETINYAGSAGYYRFRVLNYRGTGAYSFDLSKP